MSLPRRGFLAGSAASIAFAGLARAQQADGVELTAAQIAADPYRSEVTGYGRLR